MITQQLNRWQGMDFEMEEIGGGDTRHRDGRDWWRGTDVRPTQIALVFDAGGNCAGDTALMNPLRLVGR
jgi:hypothetical protein